MVDWTHTMQRPEPAGTAGCDGMHIMLIDDDLGSLYALETQILMLGYSVQCFSNPVIALSTLREQPADLVISDAGLPVMDGYTLALRVAETIGTCPPRVLLLAAPADFDPRLLAMPAAEVIGVLAKPCQAGILRRVLSMIAKTRACCPGTVAALPAPASDPHNGFCRKDTDRRPCCSRRYADCAGYNAHGGLALRHWIESLPAGSGDPAPPDALRGTGEKCRTGGRVPAPDTATNGRRAVRCKS